jgi:hypothetical protein
MKNASLKLTILFSLCTCYFLSCKEGNNKNEKPPVSGPLNLNSITTNLPEAPGYATFRNNCVSCHSARYVQMQPNFSEKTWTGIVKKMQKSYGAPISDSSVPEIVQYLVAIKGKS